jgi:hypothetical protein
MVQPGPNDQPAVRPGWYSFESCRGRQICSCGWITHSENEEWQPITVLARRMNRVELSLKWWQLSPMKFSGEMFTVPLGRQVYGWERPHVLPLSQIQGLLPPQADWDFDISFVRDPQYPHGEPRYLVQGNTILRGTFTKASNSLTATLTGLNANTLTSAHCNDWRTPGTRSSPCIPHCE